MAHPCCSTAADFHSRMAYAASSSRRAVIAFGRRAAKNAARKGKSDALKTKINSKFGKMVLQAYGPVPRAKQGGTSPDTNAQLQTVMDAAKKANVPNDVIARNLKRAEDKDVALLSDIIIEAYGPGGTGFIFECLTDNKTRASTEIWTVVKKLDGKMAEANSVTFNFNRIGEIAVAGISEDDAFEAAMETGAQDVQPFEVEEGIQDGYKIITEVNDFGSVRDQLDVMKLTVLEDHSGLTFQPMALVELEDDEQFSANEAIYDRCLDLDDVDAIFTTAADVGRNK